ncbi:MAG: hypothetical protein WBO92_04470 [Candidatus Moraniibacteriota bacterium]
MNFWEQFMAEFVGGIASGIVLAALGYLTRHRIVRAVRRSIKRIDQIEEELRTK